ncbi:DUF5632 domain-containing protein [Tsukamurella ocularis]|uniref:DUF5632 domain-containing protein n=2 Tax=Tsukamurella ocularis TaxID=1970234 RepID=UPI002168886F|nr:DUF5632 domain-containing protein [Tsukamurella ocularis]MCS3781496.1 hypothetical protein [Tsukamurella ocularis]MCS3787868.1 hypothetical protein [Tsukamurella ocularis]
MTPDDLASRALSAAQASSYAFRVASEGTTATAQLAEVDVSEFLESETGKWAQSFIGIVRVGESLVHVSHALGELARSLQQVNLEQSEIVYQVEAEIEAAQLQSAQAGIDPADRIAELIANARARAAEVAEKMVTPETTSSTKKPAAALVSGFMAFGRVPGASAEATERNGRVARNGHARSGYAIRNTRAGQDSLAVANGHEVANGHDAATGHEVANGHEAVNGLGAVNGHAGTNGHESAHGQVSAEREVAAPNNAAAAALDAFADSGDEATMDPGFMSFGRTPTGAVPHAGATASVPDEAIAGEPVVENPVEDAALLAAPLEEGIEESADIDAPVIANGFLGLGPAPSASVSAGDAAVPVVPQPLVNGFLALGRTPGAGESAVQGPSSGPIPVVAPTQFLPLPATPAEIVASEASEALGAGVGTPMTLSGAIDGPLPEHEDTRADAMDGDFLSFGRVPGGGGDAPPETTDADDPLAGELNNADDPGADDLDDLDDSALEEGDAAADAEVDFADELDAEADDLLASEEQDEDVIADVEPDIDDRTDEGPAGDEADADEADTDEADTDEAGIDEADADEAGIDEAGTDDADDADEAGEADEADAGEADVDEADTDETGADEADTDEAGIDEAGTDDADDADEAGEADEADAGEADVDEADTDETGADEADTDEAVGEGPEEGSVATGDTVSEQQQDDGGSSRAVPVAAAPEEAAPAEEAAAPADPVGSLAAAAARPVRKSGPVKFSDLLKAANATKVEPARRAPAAFVAAKDPVVPPEGESATPAEPTRSALGEEQAEELTAPAKPAPVLATGPAILGRIEPLVLREKVSPVVQQVHDAVASILGSLRGGPHTPESGLHWAAGLLVKDAETIMAVTTSDAGWLPPGVVIPAGVRVLWNMPAGYRWASIDDPVRQLIEYAEQDGYTLTAVATTHPSRAYAEVVGEENVVGVLRPGAVLPGGRSRFEATVSPARLQHIRSLDREQAERQARALIRDLETQPIAPEHAIGIEAARIDARCFLDERDDVPPAVLEQLHADERALGDALVLDRTPASAEDLTAPAPDAARLRDRMLERAILVATLAAAYHDIESAVYAWTYARFLSSQDQDSEQAR